MEDNKVTIYKSLLENVEVKDRKYHLQSYKKCFIGSEAVDFLINAHQDMFQSRAAAEKFMHSLEEDGLFSHVTKDHEFKDTGLFYRWFKNEPHLGVNGDVIWEPQSDIQVTEPDQGERPFDLQVSPLDEHNLTLLNHVKPKSWNNPHQGGSKGDHFTLLVIGAGAGGLISAIQGAGIGLKTALIEKHLLGGDCLNVGCVPSKALLRCARAIREARKGAQFGIQIDGLKVDFPEIMSRMRKLRAKISPADSYARYTKFGVSVFQGKAKFVGKNSVLLNDQVLTFSKAVIATGGRANIPDIPGLKECNYLTNSSLFNLEKLPEVFGIIGSGAIGVEMAQAFTAFGSKVFVFESNGYILQKEEKEAAAIVQQSLEQDGVQFHFNVTLTKFEQVDSKIHCYFMKAGKEEMVELDDLLISAGRVPNIEELDLEAANVKYSKRGIIVNDNLQSSNKNIYAVGDVCMKFQFTHVADAGAKVAFRNMFFPFQNNKVSALVVPWCTYTSPELAHVGKFESDGECDVYVTELEHNDRAILEENIDGYVKLMCKKGTDEIIGATIVADNAGDMISEITACITNKVGANGIAATIHPYPTTADAIRICAGQVAKKRLTPTTKNVLNKLANFKAG